MFCSQCGTKYEDTDAFCPQCGNPLQPLLRQSTGDPIAHPTLQSVYAPRQVSVTLPPRCELAIILIFWAGHVLALLGWILAIICWVKAGQPLVNMHNLPFSNMTGISDINIGNPLKGVFILMGFGSFLTGHLLQIACFWASEVLHALILLAGRQDTKPAVPIIP